MVQSIYGGQDVKNIEDFPWMAKVITYFDANTTGSGYINLANCGGVIISKKTCSYSCTLFRQDKYNENCSNSWSRKLEIQAIKAF